MDGLLTIFNDHVSFVDELLTTDFIYVIRRLFVL